MKKIYTKLVYQWTAEGFTLSANEHYYYEGKVANCGGGSGGGGSSTTVQKADPWAGQQPYLTTGFQQAQQQYIDSPPPAYFPGSTVVPFSPETEAALQLTTQRALQGSPLQAAANNQLTSTLNGDYLYGSPGFEAAVKATTNKVLPQIDSAFERAGRTGSGLAQTAKTQAIADAYASQYANERENQQRANFFAPQMMAQDYQDYGQLANVGAARESLSQEQLADQMARYNYDQNARKQMLNDYMNLIQGNYGSQSSSTTTGPGMSRNIGAGMLGGALSGASMASMMGFGPPGMAIGAGIGLLGGGFF